MKNEAVVIYSGGMDSTVLLYHLIESRMKVAALSIDYGQRHRRGSKQNLRAEIEYYLDVERRARIKWRKQMAELEASEKPDIRLAAQMANDAQIRRSGIQKPSE